MQLAPGPYIDGLDIRALTWLHQFIGRSPAFDALAASSLSNHLLKFGPVVFVICWLWFDARPNQEWRRERLVQALLTAVGALLLGRVLALALPFRDRPIYRVDLNFVYPLEPGVRTWSAFPSDHAVVAFALAAALARLSPVVGAWAFAHAAVVVCFPRVYFGLHHTSDVIGGALIGLGLAAVIEWLPAQRARHGVLMRVEQERPALFYAVGFVLLYEIMTMFEGLRWAAGTVFAALRQINA